MKLRALSLLLLVCAAACSDDLVASEEREVKIPPIFTVPSVDTIASGFTNFDLDGDGIREINSLTPMTFQTAAPTGTGASGMAIVLVDPRLLASFPGSLAPALTYHLTNYRDDLVRDGYQTRFFLADVYRGAEHQDGRTLLAMRRFLQSVRAWGYPLAGVTLVGSFPEATLFRRVLSRTVENNQQFLTLHPERINPRAEIVLADLDGNWEPLYRKVADMEHLRMLVPSNVSFPANGQSLSGTVDDLQNVHWEDVFFLQDDQVTRTTAASAPGDPVTVFIASTAQRNPELSSADLSLPNPIARPEILVGRLDAKGIAVNPISNIGDLQGRGALGPDGRPQELELTDWWPQDWLFTWSHDMVLEQRILASYFDRNHGQRNGVVHAAQYRTSAIRQQASGLMSAASINNDVLRPADPAGLGASFAIEEATLTDYVSWLGTPAVLRGIMSHSDGRNSNFGAPPSLPQLESMLGGPVWAWRSSTTAAGTTLYQPSAQALGSNASWALGRTLWENHVLMYAGWAFYVHGGCSVNVPDENYWNISYDEDFNGFKNNGDSVLFFLNGLGLLARGKVFDDLPSNAGASIAAAGGRFAAAWRGGFDADAANASLKPGSNGDVRVLRNKKAYFWGYRGDFSVKIRY